MSAPLTALQALAESLHNCQRCPLATLGRTRVVFGVGNPEASIMFVGEAPGYNEDRKGEPFVGPAGQLLNELLQSAGLSRADVYIANVIKCRPPNNRDPEPAEVDICKPFLLQQIAIIRPSLVCTLGNWATQTLLERKVGITRVRGQAFYLKDFVVFPLLHPAAALHQSSMLAPLREDFGKLKALLDRLTHQATTTTAVVPEPPPPHIESHPPASPAASTMQRMDLFGS